mmetsp:Transcript_9803/g.25204  ORF Transcript_9803/g.25204 Transcript_9803/m.25204 type:complete len:263 (+) Transcript_9803:3-791(+)
MTALHLAASEGHPECLEALIKAGSDVMAEDCSGKTAMELLAKRKGKKKAPSLPQEVSLACVTLLEDATKKAHEEACASATESTPAVEEALRFYANVGDKARLTALLERGIANIEAKGDDQMTALHLAASEGHPECLEVLIKAGSDLMAKDDDDRTALHLAAREGHPECLEVLIKAGSDLMAKDAPCGMTALHHAADGHPECLEVLIKAGSDLLAEDDDGETAMAFAKRCVRRKKKMLSMAGSACVALLEEAGRDQGVPTGKV